MCSVLVSSTGTRNWKFCNGHKFNNIAQLSPRNTSCFKPWYLERFGVRRNNVKLVYGRQPDTGQDYKTLVWTKVVNICCNMYAKVGDTPLPRRRGLPSRGKIMVGGITKRGSEQLSKASSYARETMGKRGW